jgi:hypothetical protein
MRLGKGSSSRILTKVHTSHLRAYRMPRPALSLCETLWIGLPGEAPAGWSDWSDLRKVRWLRRQEAKATAALPPAPTPAAPRARRPIPVSVRFAVLERCGFACSYCGARPPGVVLTIDHVVPVSKGGTNDESNLVAACWECNAGKSARVLGGQE